MMETSEDWKEKLRRANESAHEKGVEILELRAELDNLQQDLQRATEEAEAAKKELESLQDSLRVEKCEVAVQAKPESRDKFTQILIDTRTNSIQTDAV